ncbi:10704_t:CDS:2, partial [Scutellospora calospora]
DNLHFYADVMREAKLEKEEDHIRCKVEEIVKEKKEKAKEALSKPDDKEPILKSR